MEPDERMSRIITTNKTNRRSSRRQRNVLVASGVMLFVAALALSVGLVSSKKVGSAKKDTPATTEATVAVTAKSSSAAQKNAYPTRTFVSELCAVGSGDMDACKDVCRNIPDCCNFHNGQDVLCLEEELEACVTHAACQVLQQEDVPAAPTELADWCDGSNPTACQQACEPVACCYDSGNTESCLRNNFLQCLDYAPCQNLRPNTRVKTAPADLDEVCNPFTGDRDTCKDVCESNGSCCWDENLFGGNCLLDNFVSCLTYAPCGTLLLDNANGIIDSPPDDLDEKCNIQELLIGDSQPCEDACEPAACCVDPNMEDNCFLADPLACVEYDSCALLFLLQRGDDVPKPPANLGQTCSLSNIRNDPEPCQQACEVASCCIDTEFQDNCLVRGNALRCREYAPCALLAIVNGGGGGDDDGDDVEEPPVEDIPVEGSPLSLEEPPEDLNEVCSVRNMVKPGGRQQCRDVCEAASCCAARGDEENCGRDNMATCLRWVSGGCWLVGF